MESLFRMVQGAAGRRAQDTVDRALATIKEHLGMEVAYLSEFMDEDTMAFRAVDAPGLAGLVNVGDSWPLDNAYCKLVATGVLPELISDTASVPLCQTIPITKDLPIRSHVSVPVFRDDGSVYGMFCCLSHSPKPGLNARDLSVMKVFADLSGEQLRSSLVQRKEHEDLTQRIRHVLDTGEFEVKYQPIVDLDTGLTTGFEALSRFRGVPYRPPNQWFEEAECVGLGVDLEVMAVKEALKGLEKLPDDTYLSVNVGPATVSSGRLEDVLGDVPMDRIVLEITEHDAVVDDDALMDEILTWRYRGAAIAVDDAGAGYSGLQRIVRLSPDMLKLDISLTRGVDNDPVRRSLAAAMVHFATETNSMIVAEGVEDRAEMRTLLNLGVHRGQGWLFGAAESLDSAVERILRERDSKVA